MFQNIFDQNKSNENSIAIKFYKTNNDLLVNEEKIVTRKELTSSCENVYKTLQKFVPKQVFVGIWIDNNLIMSSLIVGINQHQSAFVCLDPQVTFELHKEMILKLNILWLFVSNSKHNDNLNAFEQVKEMSVLSEKVILVRLKELPGQIDIKLPFNDFCYAIETSGTMGTSKIVCVTNDCIRPNIVDFINTFNITASDVILFNTPITFDPFIIEIFISLLTNATLIVSNGPFSPKKIHEIFRSTNFTFFQTTPSLFFSLDSKTLKYLLRNDTSLRILALGGEIFPGIIRFEKFRSKNCRTRIFNLYGITEMSVWASLSEINFENWNGNHIGVALSDTKFEINHCSELVIKSDKRLTTIIDGNLINKNVRDHQTGDVVKKINGQICFIARKFNMVKRFGHKIYLDDLEKRCEKIVNEPCSCLYLNKRNKLILFVENRKRMKILENLILSINRNLPKWSQIDDVLEIEKIPTTKNGKVNRGKLVTLWKERNSNVNFEIECNSKCTHELFKLFEKYLTINNTDFLKESFKNLGGTSIMALQITNEYQRICPRGSKITEYLFDETLTIRQIIELVGDELNTVVDDNKPNEDRKTKKIKTVHGKTFKNKTKVELVKKFSVDLMGCVDATPFIAVLSDSREIVTIGSHAHQLTVTDINTGSKIVHVELPDRIESSGCVFNDRVYVGCYDSCLYCVNIKTGTIEWNFKTGSRIKTMPILVDDKLLETKCLVFGSYDGFLYCLRVDDQSLTWKMKLDAPINSTPLHYKSKIYVPTIKGTCFCLNINGSIIWRVQSKTPIFGTGAIHESLEIIAWPNVKGEINFFNCVDGQILFTFQAGDAIFSSIKTHKKFGDLMFFGCHDSFLYGLKVKTDCCLLKYKWSLGGGIYSTPELIVDGDGLFVIGVNVKGEVFLCDVTRNSVENVYNFCSEVFSSPIFYKNRLFVGCRDNFLHCLSLNTVKEFLN